MSDKLTLDNAPLGTKAPATGGGHWVKVARGWKWFNGDTFPTVGGDWDGTLIPPAVTAPTRGPEPEAREPMTHVLKVWPEYFDALLDGRKTFEWRKADRDYRVGDTLLLREWTFPNYSGREVARTISYIMRPGGFFDFPAGYVVLGFAALSHQAAPPGEADDTLLTDLRAVEDALNGLASDSVDAGEIFDVAASVRMIRERVAQSPLPAPEDAGRREAWRVELALEDGFVYQVYFTEDPAQIARVREAFEKRRIAGTITTYRAAAAGETRERENGDDVPRLARRVVEAWKDDGIPCHQFYVALKALDKALTAAPAREPGASEVVPRPERIVGIADNARPTEPGEGEHAR